MNRIGCYLLVDKARTGNGITRCERGTDSLIGGEWLCDPERDDRLALCRQRFDVLPLHAGQLQEA